MSTKATSNTADTEHEYVRRKQDPRHLDYDGDGIMRATASDAGSCRSYMSLKRSHRRLHAAYC